MTIPVPSTRSASRADIETALFTLLRGVGLLKDSSQRFVMWDVLAQERMPFLCLLKGGERREGQSETNRKLILEYSVFIYTDVGVDPNTTPSVVLNNILDAIETVLLPIGRDAAFFGRQTLGDKVSHCYISGNSVIDTGDVDGRGLALIPVEILVP